MDIQVLQDYLPLFGNAALLTVGLGLAGIAPAVSKGNSTLLNWLNDEIKALGNENFFHKDYEATLVDTYGLDYENSLVVEGGVIAAAAVTTAAQTDAAPEEVSAKGTIKVAATIFRQQYRYLLRLKLVGIHTARQDNRNDGQRAYGASRKR